jgi:hypothetical protein
VYQIAWKINFGQTAGVCKHNLDCKVWIPTYEDYVTQNVLRKYSKILRLLRNRTTPKNPSLVQYKCCAREKQPTFYFFKIRLTSFSELRADITSDLVPFGIPIIRVDEREKSLFCKQCKTSILLLGNWYSLLLHIPSSSNSFLSTLFSSTLVKG